MLTEIVPTPADARRAIAYLLAKLRDDELGQIAILEETAEEGRVVTLVSQMAHIFAMLADDTVDAQLVEFLQILATESPT